MVRLKIDVMPSWSEILRSVEANPNRDKQIEHLAAIRFDYLERLAQKTGRNVITYYSAFCKRVMFQILQLMIKILMLLWKRFINFRKRKG